MGTATPALPLTVENPVEPMRIVELDEIVREKDSTVRQLFLNVPNVRGFRARAQDVEVC